MEKKDKIIETLSMVGSGIAAIFFLWWWIGEDIARFFLTIKLWELKLLHLVLPVGFLETWIERLEVRNMEEWGLLEMLVLGIVVNIPFLGYPIYRVIARARHVSASNPGAKFKRVMTMKTLMASEVKLWPCIAPMMNQNPLRESLTEGPWAMALKPLDYARKFRLLTDERDLNSLDRKKLEKLLISQLGRPYVGWKKMRKHERALAAISAAFAAGATKEAKAAADAISMNCATLAIDEMPDLSPAEPLYKYLEDPRVKRQISRHAYNYTILWQLFAYAGEKSGVWPSNNFLWLRTRDLLLFELINAVGRDRAWASVCGIRAHWSSEVTNGAPLEMPMVGKAIKGFVTELNMVKLAPLEVD